MEYILKSIDGNELFKGEFFDCLRTARTDSYLRRNMPHLTWEYLRGSETLMGYCEDEPVYQIDKGNQ